MRVRKVQVICMASAESRQAQQKDSVKQNKNRSRFEAGRGNQTGIQLWINGLAAER
jgi:hypothetical protein